MSPLSWMAVVGLAATLGGISTCRAERFLVYVGTYTGPKSAGIHVVRFDTDTGKAGVPQLAAKSVNPTFLSVHPDGHHLYAANETDQWEGRPGGYVSAFAIDQDSGMLTAMNQQSTGGGGPCHLVTDRTGTAVLVANYGGGSVAGLPLKADGSLSPRTAFVQHTGSGPNKDRQSGAHAHSINLSPDGKFALVADLGTDRISIYRFEAKGASLKLQGEVAMPPGSGPRHLVFSPDGRRIFVISEMRSTLASFAWDAVQGAMEPLDSKSTLPPGFSGDASTAEVAVHPNGRFVYGSNRGHDSIALFRAASDGKLELVENVSTGGKTPRNFALDPTGKFLWAANQGSDSVVIFTVDPESGHLTPTGQVLNIGSPVCVQFVPMK
jgi:6-phosphogluconolactonase